MGNLRDKNDRAIRAYLKTALLENADLNEVPNFYISMDSDDRSTMDDAGKQVGLVDIKTVQGPESPLGSGCFMFTTLIRAKMPSVDQPNETAGTRHADLGSLVEAIQSAMRLSDNHQDYHLTAQLITEAGNGLATGATKVAGNDDMADYSCLNIIQNTEGGDKEGNGPEDINFVEVIVFQSLCASYNGYWS